MSSSSDPRGAVEEQQENENSSVRLTGSAADTKSGGSNSEQDDVNPFTKQGSKQLDFCPDTREQLRQADCNILGWRRIRYWFRHPVLRTFICTIIIFMNFLMYAEDPIAHSKVEANLPVIGNGLSQLFNTWPTSKPGIIAFKFFYNLLWVFLGLMFGHRVVHHWLLRDRLRISMFQHSKGTWFVMFFTLWVVLFVGSKLYNVILVAISESYERYQITEFIGITNEEFYKIAASGTWMGDYLTAYMVIDIMLQDKLYPGWAQCARRGYRGQVRIYMFWIMSVTLCTTAIVFITGDYINWDDFGDRFDWQTTELGRAFLASMITLFDLLIVMQDWEFPSFITNQDIKLPGLDHYEINFKFLRDFAHVHITGKWFNYGIIACVMILDMNMLKNQVLYDPVNYGQYTGPENKIFTVVDPVALEEFARNSSAFTFESRMGMGDLRTNSKYAGYSYPTVAVAILPAILGAILFIVLLIYEDPAHWEKKRKRDSEKYDKQHKDDVPLAAINNGNTTVPTLAVDDDNNNDDDDDDDNAARNA